MNTIETLYNRLEHRCHRLIRVPTGKCNGAFDFSRLSTLDTLLCLDKTLVGGDDWSGRNLLGLLELGNAGVEGGEFGINGGRHLD